MLIPLWLWQEKQDTKSVLYSLILHLQELQRNFVNRLCPVGWKSCEYDQNQLDANPSIENTCTTPKELNEFATCQQGCAETGIRYVQKLILKLLCTVVYCNSGENESRTGNQN